MTLATIADAVGVHVSTVSRVLRHPGPHTATGAKIVQMASDLGYTPDPAASALRTRNTRLLGVLLPRITDFVPARTYEGIDEAAYEAGYTTVIAQGGDDPVQRLERVRSLLKLRVDGLVVTDARLADDQVLQEISRRQVPCVLALRRVRGRLSASVDDHVGGALAARHLTELGHRRIGVVAGPQNLSTGKERLQGFIQELAESGLHLDDSKVVPSGFDVGSGLEAARQLLAADHPPTAIFAANDEAAIGVMGALHERGMQPGADVSVIGYNDVPYAARLPIPLTSVSSPTFKVGHVASSLLLRTLNGETKIRSRRLKPHLVVRESTAPPPA